VAVKNEYEVIDRCIASLLASSYPDLEVIVVDDGSTDGTRERLIELEREHQQLRLFLLPESVKKKRALVHGLGVEFVSENEEEEWGRSIRLRIPGGVEMGLYEPKHASPLAEFERT
jgi:glycosyltransferase involved in cell wall biosynthesis